MRIAVLNGSPKGRQSVTMQYVQYIEKRFPQHRFTYIDISEKIHRLEKNEHAFREAIDVIRQADGILWAFPLYYFLVPSQYKRFIELIGERQVRNAFRNKFAAVLSTSIHIHDMMAHQYMNAICDDLHMKYTGGFSAAMYDLLKEEKRQQLCLFAQAFLLAISSRIPTTRNFTPVMGSSREYKPALVKDFLLTRGRKMLIVTDAGPEQRNLNWMVTRLQDSFFGYIETVNLRQLDIKGGCLGCLQCAYNNVCVYTKSDGFVDFFNRKVRPADILVLAGAVRERHLSSLWKCFLDRTFFNNHIPSLTGKQVGFLISGPLGQLPGLRQYLEAYVEIQQANLAGIVSDEYPSAEIDALISLMADQLVRYSLQGYRKPPSYLEVGVRKILRDQLWKNMRFPFRSDHRYFKKEGLYDFPKRKIRDDVKNAFLFTMTSIPFIRKEIYARQMKPGTIEPLMKVVAAAGPEKN